MVVLTFVCTRCHMLHLMQRHPGMLPKVIKRAMQEGRKAGCVCVCVCACVWTASQLTTCHHPHNTHRWYVAT
jgi:hypothetical protein